MRRHIERIRELCAANHTHCAPYVVRTRFERELYGLAACVAQIYFGRRLTGLGERQIADVLGDAGPATETPETGLLRDIGRVFRRFTYLCDTSNWSNDGQDPRVEACKPELLALCDAAEQLASVIT